MHPVLFHLRLGAGQLEVHSFGVLVAVGCLASYLFSQRESRRRGLDEDAMRDLWFYTLIASLVGARLAFLATAGRPLFGDCQAALGLGVASALSACVRPLRVWEGGLVFYGGVVAGAACAVFYARRSAIDWRAAFDALAPSLALGHAIGRLGCFAAGCCFGQPTASPLGVAFPERSIAWQDEVARGLLSATSGHTPPLHPTQLYECAGELLLFALLVRTAPRLRRAGDVALAWLAGYAVLRFALEVFRGDAVRAFVVERATPTLSRALSLPEDAPTLLSTSQLAALCVLAIVGATLALRRRTKAPA